MNIDLLLLIAGGILTLLGAGLVLLLSPPRYPTFVASVALAGLGLLQLGLARAVYTGPEAESGIWFHLTLALSISVALTWTLLSRTLGMGPEPSPLGIWKFYIVGQALAAVGGLAWVVLAATPLEMTVLAGRLGYPLGEVGSVVAAGALVHLVLTTASFESTYMALRRSDRRAFLPALVGILMANGYFTYVC
ncbi:MAG TPA: hypothetical protein VFV24_02400, partial [Candidatus Eisenbacteria bacterium]|nr:hypothetical protein [Candidatus Eisenbacteria bacterium]